MNPYYRDYGDFLAERFEGKVQKLSIDAGFTCPNRDGTAGRGGCAYCSNAGFSPDVAKRGLGVKAQIERGRRFFGAKYPAMRYLAYFQSYTSTHAPVGTLLGLYEDAIAEDDVAGLVIGTRPDCMPDDLLAALRDINMRKRVIVEYGAESAHDATLQAVNRCHTWHDTVDAVTRTHAAGLDVGLHLIMGLPGETRAMMLETVDHVNDLPVDAVKFHQMQILRGTALAHDYSAATVWTLDDYVDFCAVLVRRMRPDIAIERFVSQCPPRLLLAPRWGIKNHEFTALLHRRLKNLSDRDRDIAAK